MKNNSRKEINKNITLAFEQEEDVKKFEKELYTLGAKHNIYIIINYDKEAWFIVTYSWFNICFNL